MSRLFYHTMQDNTGNLLFDVSGTMRLAGSGTLATIYGDEALTVILPNPMTNHPSFGSFKCFLGSGDYDFYMAKSGYTFEVLTGVQGHGTMAQQDASAVAITGGSATFTGLVQFGNSVTIPNRAGDSQVGIYSDFALTPGAGRGFINHGGTANSYFGGGLEVTGRMALGTTLALNTGAAASHLKIDFTRGLYHGIAMRPNDSDTVGPAWPIVFLNTGLIAVGNIATTATTTAYNTTSDARLKHEIAPLTGALDVVRALNPITHRWKADDSPGVSFLAHEVQAVIPDGVITGEKDAVDEDGGIIPQMIDYGKLVPYLVSAVKELTQQVEMLQAQLAAVGA